VSLRETANLLCRNATGGLLDRIKRQLEFEARTFAQDWARVDDMGGRETRGGDYITPAPTVLALYGAQTDKTLVLAAPLDLPLESGGVIQAWDGDSFINYVPKALKSLNGQKQQPFYSVR